MTGALKWSNAATYCANIYYSAFFYYFANESVPPTFNGFVNGLTLLSCDRKSLPALKVFNKFFYSLCVISFIFKLFCAESRKAILFLISYTIINKLIIFKTLSIIQ